MSIESSLGSSETPRNDGEPPRFEPPGESAPWTATAGDALALCTFARNEGGPGSGFAVTAWGPAVEQGHVELDQVEVSVGGVRACAEFLASEGFLVAVLFGFDVPAGGYDPAAWLDADPEQTSDALRRQLECQIDVVVHGTALTHGRAGLHLSFIPLDNPGRGQITEVIPIVVEPNAHTSGIVSVADMV